MSGDFLGFNSNSKAPYHELSNFNLIEGGLEFEGIVYPSVEHAYQAQKVRDEKMRRRFSVDGIYGTTEAFSLFYGKDSSKKHDYWMKKKNIGILAKLAINRMDKFSLRMIDRKKTMIAILMVKYSKPHYKEILLSTGGKTLYECATRGKPSEWTARLKDGHLEGGNYLGECMMIVRDAIMREERK